MVDEHGGEVDTGVVGDEVYASWDGELQLGELLGDSGVFGEDVLPGERACARDMSSGAEEASIGELLVCALDVDGVKGVCVDDGIDVFSAISDVVDLLEDVLWEGVGVEEDEASVLELDEGCLGSNLKDSRGSK